MDIEWIYSNLTFIVVVLGIATVILFIFPVLLGKDLLKKSKKKEK